MRKVLAILRLLVTVVLVCVCAGCGTQQSGLGTLQFYVSGGDIVRQGLLTKDGWQLSFDHVYVTVAEVTAYQTDPPYDPVYSADIIHYEISAALEGTHTIDLEGGEDALVLLGEVADVTPGAYNALSWRMAPAGTGDAAGHSLVLIGQATKEGQTIRFAIKLNWDAKFLCGDYFKPGEDLRAQKGRLDPGGTADLEITFALDSVFGDGTTHPTSVLNRAALGFEPLAALAQGGALNADLSSLQAGLSDDDFNMLEDALPELAYTGARLCYHLE